MLRKFIALLAFSYTLISCQFTETMVLQEDGSGTMSLSIDLSEMMSFAGEMSKDSTITKTDTIITFKDILREKKDSIAKLSSKDQKKLKAMENYKIHMVTDPETNKMVIDIFTDFKNVSEANGLMDTFKESDDLIPSMNEKGNSEDDSEEDNIAVKYSYKKGVFKRDAYIIDVEKHKSQVDSLKQIESFMSGMVYKLKYTFPRKIKSTSANDATFSLDGKTIELERSFLEYIKNPDTMDLEVKLER